MAGVYQELKAYAQELGWVFHRQGSGDHEIWRHPQTGRKLPIPTTRQRHGRALLNIKANLRRAAQEVPHECL